MDMDATLGECIILIRVYISLLQCHASIVINCLYAINGYCVSDNFILIHLSHDSIFGMLHHQLLTAGLGKIFYFFT